MEIACDNPACPGNSLDAADRAGWIFVTTSSDDTMPLQSVFCCPDCAGSLTQVLAAREAEGAESAA